MNAYSEDLRQRIVEVVDRGVPRPTIVTMFHVSLATIKRYLKQRRETGTLTANQRSGRPPAKRVALAAGLPVQLAADPDATLEMHCERWAALTGVHVSTATMSREIRRLGWTGKKSVGAADRDAMDFVIVDESGTNINLTPRYARAPRGQRPYGSVPRNTPPNTTLIASLTHTRMGPAMLLSGATDTAAFEVYIAQVLAPSLVPGQTSSWTTSVRIKVRASGN